MNNNSNNEEKPELKVKKVGLSLKTPECSMNPESIKIFNEDTELEENAKKIEGIYLVRNSEEKE